MAVLHQHLGHRKPLRWRKDIKQLPINTQTDALVDPLGKEKDWNVKNVPCTSMLHGVLSTLQWRHNERDGISNHQPHDCLLNLSASLALLRGIERRPVNSPHKGPVTRQMFPFDDVIMEGKCAKSPTWQNIGLQPLPGSMMVNTPRYSCFVIHPTDFYTQLDWPTSRVMFLWNVQYV